MEATNFSKDDVDKVSLWHGRKLIHLLTGGHNLGRGGNFNKFIYWGSHRGASHWGIWTGVYGADMTLEQTVIQRSKMSLVE